MDSAESDALLVAGVADRPTRGCDLDTKDGCGTDALSVELEAVVLVRAVGVSTATEAHPEPAGADEEVKSQVVADDQTKSVEGVGVQVVHPARLVNPSRLANDGVGDGAAELEDGVVDVVKLDDSGASAAETAVATVAEVGAGGAGGGATGGTGAGATVCGGGGGATV